LQSNSTVTPRPRRFLLLSLALTTLFAVLAFLVAGGSAIVRLDRWISDGGYHFSVDHPSVHGFFRAATDLGWGDFLNWVGAAAIIVFIIRREWTRTAVFGLGLYSIHWIVPFLKGLIERPRPEFADVDGFSFPSGHAFGAAAVYGLLGLLLLRVWAESRWRWVWAIAVWSLIPLVGLSRIMLGVHYPSDVLAGIAIGLGWIFLCVAVTDWWEIRQRRLHERSRSQ
jgi:membrane-associated phospholipid phosphatase